MTIAPDDRRPGRTQTTGSLRLPLAMADFARRGFRLDRPAERAVLEGHAHAFLDGFNIAVRHWRDPPAALDTVPVLERGFAYEGAGMHAAVRDTLTGGRARALERLLDGPGDAYVHLVHVGYGWAFVPLRVPLPVPLAGTPLLRWLALDGAGFAETFFGGRIALRRRAAGRGRAGGPRAEQRWAARTVGCGRALWFVESAHVPGVVDEIAMAPAPARPHLWSGVGLACTYAGCAGTAEVAALRAAAGPDRDHFLQGVMFGVTARSRSGAVPDHTRTIAREMLDATPQEVARWTDDDAVGLTTRADVDAYDTWRARLRTTATTRTDVAR